MGSVLVYCRICIESYIMSHKNKYTSRPLGPGTVRLCIVHFCKNKEDKICVWNIPAVQVQYKYKYKYKDQVQVLEYCRVDRRRRPPPRRFRNICLPRHFGGRKWRTFQRYLYSWHTLKDSDVYNILRSSMTSSEAWLLLGEITISSKMIHVFQYHTMTYYIILCTFTI